MPPRADHSMHLLVIFLKISYATARHQHYYTLQTDEQEEFLDANHLKNLTITSNEQLV